MVAGLRNDELSCRHRSNGGCHGAVQTRCVSVGDRRTRGKLPRLGDHRIEGVGGEQIGAVVAPIRWLAEDEDVWTHRAQCGAPRFPEGDVGAPAFATARPCVVEPEAVNAVAGIAVAVWVKPLLGPVGDRVHCGGVGEVPVNETNLPAVPSGVERADI